jgi:hypothetical protein
MSLDLRAPDKGALGLATPTTDREVVIVGESAENGGSFLNFREGDQFTDPLSSQLAELHRPR